jgi:hypothetical protein
MEVTCIRELLIMLNKTETLLPLVMLIYMVFSFSAPISGLSADFPYIVNDLNFYPIPDTPKPDKGVPYIDPVFGTEVVRITDGEQGNYMTTGYPKWDVENCDGTMLLFPPPNHYIWQANPPYEKIADLPRNIYDTKDPDLRWSKEDPQVLYTTYGNGLFIKYNVITGERVVLHDFKEDFPGLPIARVFTGEEGDCSDDGRYWAFMVNCYDSTHTPTWWNSHILVYDKDFYGKDNGKVISVLPDSDPLFRSPDSICMSPSGNYVQVGAPPSYIYPRDLSSIRKITTHGHVDFAVDNTGREVLVWVDHYYGPDGYTDYKYWVIMADVETGERFWLGPFGGYVTFHVSGNCHKKPGWAAISSYWPLVYTTEPTQWSDASVIMYELTRANPRPSWDNHAKVWRVVHTHMARKDYGDDPFAKLNAKGTKIWFGSGWGKCATEGQGPYDVYQINLPPTWYEDLKGNINMAPIASISADPMSGNPPLTVSFTGNGKDYDGEIVSYAWTFGDGATSTEQNPIHTYNNVGVFTVTLTVTDDDGATGRAYVQISADETDTTPPSPPRGLTILE